MKVQMRWPDSRWVLVSILAFGFVVRVGAALILGDRADAVSGAADQVSYDALAQSILAGRGYSFPTAWYPFTQPNTPTAHWSFLYSLYLAGVYALFGHHPLAARLVQVLLSMVNLLLAYRLGRRLFGHSVGLAAAGLTAGYAYLIFFNAALMTQTFYILALFATMEMAFALYERPTAKRWILLGFALGVGILLRQTLLLFAPILFTWLWWSARHAQHAQGRQSPPSPQAFSPLRGIVLAFAVIAAIILPWTLRNYWAFQDFLLLNSNGGYWLYASEHPAQGWSFDPNLAPPIPPRLDELGEPAIDRALYQEAWGFIINDPFRILLLSISRIEDYFWILPSLESTWISNLARLVSFGLYLPFMLYGLILSRRHWRVCMPLYLYVLFDTALCLFSWSAPRYRLPSDAIMMTFAGLAALDLLKRFGLRTPEWMRSMQ